MKSLNSNNFNTVIMALAWFSDIQVIQANQINQCLPMGEIFSLDVANNTSLPEKMCKSPNLIDKIEGNIPAQALLQVLRCNHPKQFAEVLQEMTQRANSTSEKQKLIESENTTQMLHKI